MCKKSNLNLHQLYIEYIMRNTFILFCLIWLVGCTNQPKAPTDSALPVLDLTKDYPEMDIDLQEIADVEYIPLETTEKSIAAYFLNPHISENISSHVTHTVLSKSMTARVSSCTR